MAGAALLVTTRRCALTLVGCTAVAIALSGCSWFRSSVGESEEQAQSGIVSEVDYLATNLAVGAFTLGSEVTPEYLATLTEQVLLDPTTQAVEGLRRDKAIFALDIDDSAVSIGVFIPSTGQVNSGIYSESTDLFGCGVLHADKSTEVVTLADERCPDWILQWNGDEAEQVSLKEVLEHQGVASTWTLE